MFSIFTCVMSRVTHSEPGLPRVAISERLHIAVVNSFKAMFSIPRERAPRTPGLRPCVFHLGEFLVRKRTFVTLFGLS